MGAQYHNGHWYGGGQDIDIQSDPQATSLNAGEVPTGDTIESVLNTNFAEYTTPMSIPANDKAELSINSLIAKTGYEVKMVTVMSVSSTVMPVLEYSGNTYYILARNFSSNAQNTQIIVRVIYGKASS